MEVHGFMHHANTMFFNPFVQPLSLKQEHVTYMKMMARVKSCGIRILLFSESPRGQYVELSGPVRMELGHCFSTWRRSATKASDPGAKQSRTNILASGWTRAGILASQCSEAYADLVNVLTLTRGEVEPWQRC